MSLADEINKVIRAGLPRRRVRAEGTHWVILSWEPSTREPSTRRWRIMEKVEISSPLGLMQDLEQNQLIVFADEVAVRNILYDLDAPLGFSEELGGFPNPGSTGYMLSGTEGWIRVTVLDVSEITMRLPHAVIVGAAGGIEKIKVRWEEGKHRGEEKWVPANYVQEHSGR